MGQGINRFKIFLKFGHFVMKDSKLTSTGGSESLKHLVVLDFCHFLNSVFHIPKIATSLPHLIAKHSQLSQSSVQVIPSFNQLSTNELIQVQVASLKSLVNFVDPMHLVIVRSVNYTLLTGWLLAYFTEQSVLLLMVLAKSYV